MRVEQPPRVLITGACRGVGRACADAIDARGAELILCDHDAGALRAATEELGAVGRYCDVASEASVAVFAADILDSFPSLDMIINAAGGGYERTLGMYRVSRALLPALRRGQHFKLLFNIPPEDDAGGGIFPYASSGQAFSRLSAALAAETRGSSVSVLIGNPETGRIAQVLPDPNAGRWADTCAVRGSEFINDSAFAAHVAALLGPGRWGGTSDPHRQAC